MFLIVQDSTHTFFLSYLLSCSNQPFTIDAIRVYIVDPEEVGIVPEYRSYQMDDVRHQEKFDGEVTYLT